MALHKNVVEGDVHIINNYTFADEAAMNVVTGLYANSDIGKVCLVEADNSLWMLIDPTPTWVPLTGAFPGQLDGYLLISDFNTAFAGLTNTEIEHYNQLSDVVNHLRVSTDGYLTVADFNTAFSGLTNTELEHYNQTNIVLGHLMASADGYDSRLDAAESTISTHSSQISSLIGDTDNIEADVLTVKLTVDENKAAQYQVNQSVIQALDGYDSRLDAAESTISTHSSQISDLGDEIDALDITVDNHKNAQFQVNQSILQALDGYLTSVVGFVDELTFTENKNAQNQVNQSILQSLDGYLTTIGDYTPEATFQENKSAQGEINSLILQALDAYGSTAGLVSEVTFQENKAYFNGAIEDIINVLDGYSAPPGGVSELTFNENKNAQEQINQSILQSLDGYLTQVVGFVEELTFTENKNAQNDINNTILAALDSYGGGGGVSELTFTENKNAQEQINQSILQALDGYGGGGGGVSEVTFNEFKVQYSQVIQSLRQACDAYGGDGYIYSLKSLPISMAGAGYSLNSSEVRTSVDEPIIYHDFTAGVSLSGVRFVGTSGTAYYLDWVTCLTPIPADYYSGGIMEFYGCNSTAGTQVFEFSISGFRVTASVAGTSTWGANSPGNVAFYVESKKLGKIYELDLAGVGMTRNDLIALRMQRSITDASDTNTGAFYWAGATLWYIGRDVSK